MLSGTDISRALVRLVLENVPDNWAKFDGRWVVIQPWNREQYMRETQGD